MYLSLLFMYMNGFKRRLCECSQVWSVGFLTPCLASKFIKKFTREHLPNFGLKPILTLTLRRG